ncbi:hypothetical protein [Tenacibaculum sp. 47A_GOM-205m]|uniref:hypothetical protein n=1 Tax=Tenacibaculum sp. 47A_GOM-205m TaxID=1380384 RepID=UPI00048D2276|nr:hypothetical protein [Tenacibaculum sp. 47A_GOM-205m]
MITKSEKNKLKKILGHRYVADVLNCLRSRGIKNKDGEEYSASMIHNVMNGQSHEEIETAIYELAARKKEAAKKRKDLLKSK